METNEETKQGCRGDTEVYSRVTGYHRPIRNWNAGKRAEYEQRVNYSAKFSGDSGNASVVSFKEGKPVIENVECAGGTDKIINS